MNAFFNSIGIWIRLVIAQLFPIIRVLHCLGMQKVSESSLFPEHWGVIVVDLDANDSTVFSNSVRLFLV